MRNRLRHTIPAWTLVLLAITTSQSSAIETDWPSNGRTSSGQFFSPLTQLNPDNASRLGFAWQFKTGTFRGMEGTPLVIDGVMFVPGLWGSVYALDARSGRTLWTFDPPVDRQHARSAGNDVSTRGLAVHRGKVYAIATDCHLFALDAKSGRVLWSVNTLDRAELDYACNGAPQVAGRIVAIGNAGGDNGRGGMRGYVSAYDLDTGRRVWRLFTVPSLHDTHPTPELAKAASTWDPHRDPSFGGGGAVWALMSHDPTLGLLYFGTGNAAPYDAPRDWSGGRSTDRLYAASILAIDAATGKMRWHYQTTPGDVWDFDANANLILADIRIDGRMRQVLMQANKNGYFYVIDRRSGEPLRAQPFAYLNWSTGMTPDFRPLVSKTVDYSTRPAIVYPSLVGAHSWPPMSFSPKTQLVYIPVIEMANIVVDLSRSAGAHVHSMDTAFDEAFIFPEKGLSYDAQESLFGPLPRFPLTSPDGLRPMVRSVLKAIDPTTGRVAWQQPISQDYWVLDGGILSTASGLVLAGREDGRFVVYHAATGRVLKEIDTGSAIMAAPMSYAIDGRQYVAVLCGHGGAKFDLTGTAAVKYLNEGRVLVFALDGAPEVPRPARRTLDPYREPPARTGSPEQVTAGKHSFIRWCSRCHTLGGPGLTPDLSQLNDGIGDLSTFLAIVRAGAFVPLGMPRFGDVLSESEAADIHHFLIDQSWEQLRHQQESSPEP